MQFEKWLQSRLTVHGFATGAIDGIIGPITTSALKAFQSASVLTVTGTATPETVAALRKSGSSQEAPIADRQRPVPVWPRQSGVRQFFGDVGERQTRVDIPWAMYLAWDKSIRITRMTLHEKVAESAERAFEAIASAYTAKEITDLGLDLFGGSLNVRRMRGGSAWSMHSWGIAIDFDPIRNQLRWDRARARLAQPDAELFWNAWESEGWVSLGRAKNYDWMHVQAARL